MNEELVSRLRRIAPVKLDEPMARHTTFGVGGPADAYILARNEDQLRLAFSAGKQAGIPVFVFGSGSNVLVGDLGVRGLVIQNKHQEVTGPAQDGDRHRIRVGSGMSFSTLARRMAAAGYGGLEWACGIPGSLGGAVVTNAGAYGQSLADVLLRARLGDTGANVAELATADLDLSYRNSAFTRGNLVDSVVLSVDLRVAAGDPAEMKRTIREYDRDRRAAQPPGRNCGSVFKNPDGKSAWQYVDEAGLRGHRIGNAQISEQHSNFILNLGGATAGEVLGLIRLAQERIRKTTGIEMTPEVMLVGEFA
jgi:UDP-N-acetylmuramate dehydrogenase